MVRTLLPLIGDKRNSGEKTEVSNKKNRCFFKSMGELNPTSFPTEHTKFPTFDHFLFRLPVTLTANCHQLFPRDHV